MGADKGGAPVTLVEPGELDQEQHDAVRDVFVAPGGCVLVRADLFEALGGFDEGMSMFGEDLDLSWRAQVAGARVVVAPGARVRHLEATASGRRGARSGERVDLDELRRRIRPLQLRHRLRAVLKNYGLFHLVRVVPQVVLLSLVEMIFGALTGHAETSRDIGRAWRWNLRHLSEIRTQRRGVRATRRLGDGEVRRLQARGSARITAFLRGQLAADRVVRLRGVTVDAGGLAGLRLPLAAVATIALVLLVGTRHLLVGHLAAVGELAPFPSGPLGFLAPFLSGWRTTGLGAEAPAPAAFALLGLAGFLFLGAMGALQHALVLGTLPVGGLGMFRLARPFGSPRARLVSVAVYFAIPLSFSSLAGGRWGGLVAFAAAPWVVARLMRATGLDPVEPGADVDGDRDGGARGAPQASPRLPVQAVRLGMVLAVAGAITPAFVPVALVAAAGLLAGSAIAGAARRAWGAVAVSLGAGAVAFALLFPWSLEAVLPGSQGTAVLGAGSVPSRALGLGALLRFQTGAIGGASLGWAFVLAAVLPLLIGREWRLAWATRLWGMALACWVVAWTAGREWLPLPFPPEVVLAPAAVGLALAAGLGLVAFEVDLPGYRLGWRQVASLVAATAALAGAVPVLVAVSNGRWGQPNGDFVRALSWMPDERSAGDFRVLWLGDPGAMPLPGWRLSQGAAYATSRNGPPVALDGWPDAAPGASSLVVDDVSLARHRRTTQLGHLLAPLAVRYVVVPLRSAPGRSHTTAAHPPPDLEPALDVQVDLKRLESDDSLRVYENVAWVPARAALTPAGAAASRRTGADALGSSDLGGAQPVLPGHRSPTSFAGRVPVGSTVFVSETASPRWRLRVAGRPVARHLAFGWANSFSVPPAAAGRARLTYRTSPFRYGAIGLEVALWIVAVRLSVARRRGGAGDRDGVAGREVDPASEPARPAPALAEAGP